MRCLRRENRIPRFRGGDALFRRLPADRSHGRARPRNLAPWADEAVRPHRLSIGRRKNPMPWCNCDRTTSSARLFNMVGFQTKLKHGEQARIFRTIPGLGNAEFARLGGLHRNTFLNSPKLLDATLRLKTAPRLRFAGQITGCEGYVESAAIGLLAGRFAAAERLGETPAATAADHRPRRAPRPHYRRPYRDHRRRTALVSADERQFRPVPAARIRSAADRGTVSHGRRAAGRGMFPRNAPCANARWRIWRPGLSAALPHAAE